MIFKYNSESKLTECKAEVTDICVLCNLFDGCPLVGALEINLVYPSASSLTIEDCPIFERIDISL